MQTFLTGFDLILWIAVAALCLALLLTALFSLFRKEFDDARTELGWVVLIIFVPVVGPVLYFVYSSVRKRTLLKQHH